MVTHRSGRFGGAPHTSLQITASLFRDAATIAPPPGTRNLPLVSDHSIRPAAHRDCAALARLVTELGYPTSAEQMNVRLGRLLASTNDLVLVAETTTSPAIVGWIHGTMSQCLEADYRVEIAGLLVNEEFHRRGIATALVRSVEKWGLEQGAVQGSVRCRTTRPEAHLFYERLGYRQNKTQIVFRKAL